MTATLRHGSAVKDATRETGGTLGVAVIGSVYASLYVSQLAVGARDLRRSALGMAKSSVGAGYALALPDAPASARLVPATPAIE